MQAQRIRSACGHSYHGLAYTKVQHRSIRSAKRIGRAVQIEAEAVTQLLSWAKDKNISLDKISLVEDVADNRPMVVASRDLSAGESVLTVPQNTWVTPEAAQKSAAGQLIGNLEPWLQVALFLLIEKANSRSSYQPYFSSLSGSLDTPLFWSDKELALLEGTQLLQNLQAYK
jgi:[ribulose-bisphosphate carboxylase]-lysine N-methyltransferase